MKIGLCLRGFVRLEMRLPHLVIIFRPCLLLFGDGRHAVVVLVVHVVHAGSAALALGNLAVVPAAFPFQRLPRLHVDDDLRVNHSAHRLSSKDSLVVVVNTASSVSPVLAL